MKKTKKMNSIFKNNGVLIYTITVAAFGIVLLFGILYLILIRHQITFELQIMIAFATLIEIIALSLCFVLIRVRIIVKNMEEKTNLLIQSNSKISDLNDKLRAQRHDFLNHLQVIHGLLELDQFIDANEYMKKTYEEIQSVTNILKTASPPINAILQVKQNTCERKKIEFIVLTTSKFTNLNIDIWDLCAIIGNLIDNAINAVEKSEKKKITVFIREDLKFHIIKIKDTGFGIKKEYVDKIFNNGFTTKREDGHGIGLATSKETIEKTGGTMTFKTSKKGTIFTIRTPKKTI